MKLQPLLYLISKEFRQVIRDKAMIRMIFFMPIVQLFIFAYAITTDLRNVRVGWLDQDRSVESRRLLEAFWSSGIFLPSIEASTPGRLSESLTSGKAGITLWIPKGYGADVAEGPVANIGLMVDGQNSSLAGRARSYAEAIIRTEAARILASKALEQPALAEGMRRIVPRTRFFYNPQLESRFYMIPGIVVLLITVISGMLTGMAIVKEKEVGTLEQLMVTPLTPAQLIVGKTVPFALLAFLELSFASTIAVLYFKLPFEGSVLLLAGASLLYLLVTLGAGLLASTVSQTQQQAMFTVWFFMVFGILMSGFFYPVENMPRGLYLLTWLNPLRHYIEIVRGIFLKGVTAGDIAPQLAALGLLGATIFGAAIFRFRKTNR